MPRPTKAPAPSNDINKATPHRAVLKSLTGIKALAVIGVIFGHMSLVGICAPAW